MKNRNIYLLIPLVIFILSSKEVYSTHIIGGDFKVTMTSNDTNSSNYDVQLRLYRDDVNGAVNMPASVTIGIYQIGTNNLQTIKTLYLNNGNGTIVPLGDPCFTPNPAIFRIEEGVYNGLTPVTLPNFSMGYYLHYETCCRNGLVDNLLTPTSDGISIFAIIPNPGLGQNSSPDFGSYPNDAYFCVNNTKFFTWPVTDPDGDSLVFSLVPPLDDGTNPNNGNSAPGGGAYPFYPTCQYAAGYNQFNPIGGSPQMSIDPISGEITAAPSIFGYFAFAVRVEEFRNGVKIGEVRRDAQYKSEPCITSNPPLISLNSSFGIFQSDTLIIDVATGDSLCIDLDIGVNDPLDSVYTKISSNTVDLIGGYVLPINLNNANTSLSYYNWNNIPGDTVFFNPYFLNSNGYLASTGNLYLRYCWQDMCSSIDTTLNIMIDSYSPNCSGVNQTSNNIIINCNTGTNLITNNRVKLLAFPNPTRENITISLDNFKGNIQTEVFDLIGNRLKVTNETTISLSDCAKGIYILKVTYSDIVEEIKVIKD